MKFGQWPSAAIVDVTTTGQVLVVVGGDIVEAGFVLEGGSLGCK